MDKKLTLQDYILALLFIFMLVCIVAAFFYGVQTGKKQSAAYYEAILDEYREKPELSAYHEQYLVSFYYNVYAPYREYQKNWFAAIAQMERGDRSNNYHELIRSLIQQAKKTASEWEHNLYPAHSPLLNDGQAKFRQSLMAFASALEKIDGKQSRDALLDELSGRRDIADAKRLALEGQAHYFQAIVKWNATLQPLNGQELLQKRDLSPEEWGRLNLNLKNGYIASWLARENLFVDFYPHDLAMRIDELIVTGQADQIGLRNIPDIARMLVLTKAVRDGDFLAGNTADYRQEPLPLLPMFTGLN